MTLDSLIKKLENIQIEGLVGGDVSLCAAAKRYFEKEEVQERMIELNKDQLYEETADRNGRLHNHYAPKTAKHKQRLNPPLPSDRYTFRETGKFYDSLEVVVEDEYVFIPQPMNEDYFEYLFSQYATAEDLGLSDENLLSLMPDLIDETINYIKENLNG